MGLRDSLRKAEEQGKTLARRSVTVARDGWHDAERMIRRRMRIHPPHTSSLTQDPRAADIHADHADDENNAPSGNAIVSIHGRDVDVRELDRVA